MLKHKRKVLIGICILGALTLTSAFASAAVVVNLFPSAASVGLGAEFDVDVVVFGLDTTDLAAYGIDVGFDDGVLDFESVSFGSELGYPDDSVTDVAATAGNVSVAETSLLLDFSGQPDVFSLFTMSFSAQAIGDSALSLLTLDFSDPDANAIDVSGCGDVRVVPIPAALWLFASGLLGIVGLHRRQRKSRVSIG